MEIFRLREVAQFSFLKPIESEQKRARVFIVKQDHQGRYILEEQSENVAKSPRVQDDAADEGISVKERFKRSWEQSLRGELKPVSELWDGIDAE
jgi:hypothetical protein